MTRIPVQNMLWIQSRYHIPKLNKSENKTNVFKLYPRKTILRTTVFELKLILSDVVPSLSTDLYFFDSHM